jgi:hypothetical protein
MGKPVDETNATLISLIKAMVPFLKNMAEVSGLPKTTLTARRC